MLIKLLPQLMEIAGSLLLVVCSWAATQIALWIRKKGQYEKVATAIIRIDDAVQTAVRQVEQTIRPMLNEISQDGLVTVEEKRQLKFTAMASVRDYLGGKGLEDSGRALKMTEDKLLAYLDGKIEAEVLALKHETQAPPREDPIQTAVGPVPHGGHKLPIPRAPR